MEKLIVFVAFFFFVDRFFDYQIDRSRKYARVEFLRKEKQVRQSLIRRQKLAQCQKARERKATQIA